jgi:CheY-like chemotaxis protein
MYSAKVHGPTPSIRAPRPDAPAGLGDLLVRMLAAVASDRPSSAEEVVWQLRSLRKQAGAEGRARPPYVLVVDDDADMLEALSLYVRAAAPDAEIETMTEGRHAVRSVRRRVPDLLLLDLDLPDINGIEVCMLLRGMKLGDACMVVSVSGRATAADVELLEQLGVRSLEKGPSLGPELRRLVERLKPARTAAGTGR